MASPDPAVVERQYYLGLLGITDTPSLSLADLREMCAGGASVKSASNVVPAVTKALLTPTDTVVNAFNDRYVPRPFIPLSTPAYFAHRGGAGYAPEETMEAFRISTAAGADGIEMDLQPLGDGTLAVMHDSTVDRTTDGTGNVINFTSPAWRALNAAAKFPWNSKVVPPALFNEVLNEFAGITYLMVEPKDTNNATQLMDIATRYGIKNTLIIATSSRSVLQQCKARGFKVCFVWYTTVGTPDSIANIVADGADYLMCDGTAGTGRPDAEITSLVATGLPVFPFTINRRSNRDRLLALGCSGFLGDQPIYLKNTTPMRTTDSWRQNVYGHGLLSTSPQNTSIVNGAIQLAGAAALAVVPGELCPLSNTFTLDIDVGFVTLPADTTRAISVSVCIADDGEYAHSGAANSFPNEYRCYLRANGQMSLYSVVAGNGGTFTQLGTTVTTAALTAGGFAHLRVTVTPTQITFARTDSAGTIGPISDSTYRGGYINLSKNSLDSAAQFKNASIS